MARSSFQKLKLLHVRNYLLQNSDEEHPITVNQMIQYLESNGIAALFCSVVTTVAIR